MYSFSKGFLLTLFIHNILYFSVQSQELATSDFYKHFSGKLDTNMKVSFDLFSQNGIIEGQYYYFFNLPGLTNLHFGKTLRLTGHIFDNRLEMNELGNAESKFTGSFESDSVIKGQWQRKNHEKPAKLYLQEDYKHGSLPLRFYSKKFKHTLEAKSEQTGKPIEAKIELQVLIPKNKNDQNAADTINSWISKVVMNDTEPVATTELLIENIIFDFIQSYVETTEGIENIGRTASFNWEKKISMRISYNENNILSVKLTKYAFTGGAHGIEMHYFKTFKLNEFKTIQLNDLFDESSQIEIGKLLERKIRRLNGIDENASLKENGFFIDSVIPNNNFYLNHDGIGFFYNIYEIASYASGTTEIFLPFSEIKEFTNEEYLPDEIK